MKLLFCTSNLPGAVLIRAVTWSSWSHVAVIVDEESDVAIEAVWPRVRKTTVTEIKRKHSKWKIVEVPVDDEISVLDFLESQVGKKYDWTALFGILFHRDWSKDSRWYCSELAAAALTQSKPLFRTEVAKRVTPQMLWVLDYPIVSQS